MFQTIAHQNQRDEGEKFTKLVTSTGSRTILYSLSPVIDRALGF
jgi:hypothetical protein